MSEATDTQSIAVIVDDSSTVAAMQDYLEANGIADARRYALRDIDDVERAIRAGHVKRVVLARLPGFLRAVWERRIDPDAWRNAEVELTFVEETESVNAATAYNLADSWLVWDAYRRRRRTIAGIILSTIATGAAFLALLASRS